MLMWLYSVLFQNCGCRIKIEAKKLQAATCSRIKLWLRNKKNVKVTLFCHGDSNTRIMFML